MCCRRSYSQFSGSGGVCTGLDNYIVPTGAKEFRPGGLRPGWPGASGLGHLLPWGNILCLILTIPNGDKNYRQLINKTKYFRLVNKIKEVIGRKFQCSRQTSAKQIDRRTHNVTT